MNFKNKLPALLVSIGKREEVRGVISTESASKTLLDKVFECFPKVISQIDSVNTPYYRSTMPEMKQPETKIKLLDTTERQNPSDFDIEAIIISEDPAFCQYIYRIINMPSLKLKINILCQFATAKPAIQQLLKWHLEYFREPLEKSIRTPIKRPLGRPKKEISETENKTEEELSPIRLIFFDDSVDNDISGTDFIQYMHRAGILRQQDIHFVLFVDHVATPEFREIATALRISFIYDVNSKLSSLLNFFEILRCTYIDAQMGFSFDEVFSKGYGPYFSVHFTRNNGTKQAVSLGISQPSKSLKTIRNISEDKNFLAQRQENNSPKKIKFR